jgi:hypothetical protein
MKAQPHVAWQLVGKDAVVVDLASGRTIGLNATGSFIWSRIASGLAEGLVADFAARFRVAPDLAATDVKRFIDYLAAQNLLDVER